MITLNESYAKALENRGIKVDRSLIIVIPDYKHKWEEFRGLGATQKESRLDKVDKEIQDIINRNK